MSKKRASLFGRSVSDAEKVFIAVASMSGYSKQRVILLSSDDPNAEEMHTRADVTKLFNSTLTLFLNKLVCFMVI